MMRALQKLKTFSPFPEVSGVALPTAFKDGAYIRLSLLGGSNYHGGNPLVPTLTAHLLGEGTKKRTKRSIHETLGALGVEVTFSCHGDRLTAEVEGLSKNIGKALPLVAEMLAEPRMSAESLEAVRQRSAALLHHAHTDTFARARIAVRQALYAAHHPNFLETPEKQIRLLFKIAREDIISFHKKLGRQNALYIEAGDVAESAKKRAKIAYRGLAAVAPPRARTARLAKNKSRERTITIPDKASVDVIVAGKTHVTVDDARYPALVLASLILSGGFKKGDRLLGTLREKEGLTYHARGGLEGFADRADGYWYGYASFAPEFYERGKKRLFEEIERFIVRGPSAEEVRRHKERYANKYLISLSKTENLAAAVLHALEDGHGTDYPQRWIERIKGLTTQDVRKAVRECMDLENAAVVSAGTI